MAKSKLVQETSSNHGGRRRLNLFQKLPLTPAEGTEFWMNNKLAWADRLIAVISPIGGMVVCRVKDERIQGSN
jgi:hypothetical protein